MSATPKVEAPVPVPSLSLGGSEANASKPPDALPKTPSRPSITTPKQPDITETMTVKELKKAYKRAKAEALADPQNASLTKAYADYKARYIRARDKNSSAGSDLAAPPPSTEQPAATSSTSSGATAAAPAASDSMARRLSRNRNRMKVAGSGMAAVMKVKRQSQSIVM